VIKQVQIIPPTNTRNISEDLKHHSHFHQKIQNSSGTGFFVWYFHRWATQPTKRIHSKQIGRELSLSPSITGWMIRETLGCLAPQFFFFSEAQHFLPESLNWSMMPLLVCACPHRCVTDPLSPTGCLITGTVYYRRPFRSYLTPPMLISFPDWNANVKFNDKCIIW